jgi:hypothetical protein
MRTKYHGMDINETPCAKPEMALAARSKLMAERFFIPIEQRPPMENRTVNV